MNCPQNAGLFFRMGLSQGQRDSLFLNVCMAVRMFLASRSNLVDPRLLRTVAFLTAVNLVAKSSDECVWWNRKGHAAFALAVAAFGAHDPL